LCLSLLRGYGSDTVLATWEDDDAQKLERLLPFFLCAFGLKLALTIFLFEFCPPLNAPSIVSQ
jgi:hypothetical protein